MAHCGEKERRGMIRLKKNGKTWKDSPPTDKEIDYWRRRWAECFPATYPPEIYTEKLIEKTDGWWIFKKHYSYYVSICRLCGERISTAHICKELQFTSKELEAMI